jgi:hypothetical protein
MLLKLLDAENRNRSESYTFNVYDMEKEKGCCYDFSEPLLPSRFVVLTFDIAVSKNWNTSCILV